MTTTNLIDVLEKQFQISHKKAKMLLTKKLVSVNGKMITAYDYPITKDHKITIQKQTNSGITILYEDSNILVVEKEAGLLTIGTTKEKENTLYHRLSEYLKSKKKSAKLFVIHRLDRDTSGIVLFAKKESIQQLYQKSWSEIVLQRGYYALVEGHLEKKKDTVSVFLEENKQYKVYVSKSGKKAITSYQVLKEGNTYSLLKINLQTGRKNQIRATMEYLGTPVVGDFKYGAKQNPLQRLGLHAYLLQFKDPISQQIRTFELPLPQQFQKNI